jgi:hypothetical protein
VIAMTISNLTVPAGRLPPTTKSLLDDSYRPYFLWWTNTTVGQLKEHLASSDPEERAYWTGALLREANTRDVWLFVTSDEIRALWPRLIRYLGRSRQMWAWLLELPPPEWPPLSQIRADGYPVRAQRDGVAGESACERAPRSLTDAPSG